MSDGIDFDVSEDLSAINFDDIKNSALARYNFNTNFLQSTQSAFVMPKLPFATYFCQSITLPGATVNPVPQETPLGTVWRHGDKAVFEPLVLTCLIDEDVKIWEETFKWMMGLTYPKKYQQWRNLKQGAGLYSDGVILTYKNSNLENVRFKFYDCFPTYIGPIIMSTQGEESALVFEVTFQYDIFEIERV